MKLPRHRVSTFLRNPKEAKVVLLYGEDAGLIRERAAALIETVLGAADDPFRLTTLMRSDELPSEAAATALGGGRRVVRLPDTGEGAREAVATVLDGPGDALVLLEAIGLTPSRSRLVKLVETHPAAVAIPCYPDDDERLTEAARTWLAARDVTIDDEALAWLVSQLGADRALSRAEVEKLAVYVGSGGRVDLAAAEACVADVAGLSLEDALFAATAGDVAMADRALERALATGATPVSVIRAGLVHLARLQRAALTVAAGASASVAMKESRPPVFFRHQADFLHALQRWPATALPEVLEAFFQGEHDAKHTSMSDDALCRHLVLALASRTPNRA